MLWEGLNELKSPITPYLLKIQNYAFIYYSCIPTIKFATKLTISEH